MTHKALITVAAAAAPRAPGVEGSIPFVDSGSIDDWRAVDRDTLYVRDVGGQWYLAKLMGPCLDLPFAERIGFDARGTNSFDRFSSIIVRGQRCALRSLVTSAPPPKKAKAHKAGG